MADAVIDFVTDAQLLSNYREWHAPDLDALRRALMLDAASNPASEVLMEFCQRRINLIDQVIAERALPHDF